MRQKQLTLWPDGEKIPDDDVVRIFQLPPEVPPSFSRSALIVGAKGVGKTTLLRYQKAIHQGVAIHLSLATELSSLPRQAGLGPLARGVPGVRSELVGNKACSLLALSVASRLLRKRVKVNPEVVADCIPRDLLKKMSRRGSKDWLRETRIRVSRAGLALFEAVPLTRPLVEFGREASQASLQAEGPLLLLLDRADLVSPLALVPVLQLLDQSPGYTALVATRPGHGGTTISRLDEASGGGDQYDVYHLGLRPFTQDWCDFVWEALAAQVGAETLTSIGKERVYELTALSRDSIRLPLEAVARTTFTGKKVDDELVKALVDLRELYAVAVQTSLRPYNHDYRGLMSTVRKNVLEKSGRVRGPVTLNILAQQEETLFPEPSRLSLLIEAALRSAGLCMPEGQIWLPGSCPTLLEAPPLLIWEPNDPWWSYADAQRQEPVPVRERDLLKSRGGPAPPPSLFVAYRVRSNSSRAFREALEREIQLHPRLSTMNVRDGKVPIGTKDWAEEIRRRIRAASLVVGDCTGMRPEVVFELGFAYGLSTTLLPVVEADTRQDLPYWLRRGQVGEFRTGQDLGDLLASIEAHLADPATRSRRGPPPVPGLAVWIGPRDWSIQAVEQFKVITEQERVTREIYSYDDSPAKTLERAALASFLVVTLDGTSSDAFAHYACGAVVARPLAGYGAKQFQRRIVVVEPPQAEHLEYTAEGLSRCEDTVIVGTPDIVR